MRDNTQFDGHKGQVTGSRKLVGHYAIKQGCTQNSFMGEGLTIYVVFHKRNYNTYFTHREGV